MRRWRLVLAALAAAGLVWTLRTSPPAQPLYTIRKSAPLTELGGSFDATRCGSIAGQVTWTGPIPTVPDIPMIQVPNPPGGKTVLPNPNAPRVSASSGVANAVVWLESIDLLRSRSWNHEDVLVEATRAELTVRQGNKSGRIGIVRRGGSATLVSREPALHDISIRGRGAAFFTQMLHDANKPVQREMQQTGVVELTSGSGYYWLRGYLLVSDHPYVAVTDSDGTFQFDRVPDGSYDLVCCKANWHIEHTERDPEWLGPVRLFYQPPIEIRKRIKVIAGQATEMSFVLSEDLFRPPH
jgi:hypothetical protein